jgi:hypothetical protein
MRDETSVTPFQFRCKGRRRKSGGRAGQDRRRRGLCVQRGKYCAFNFKFLKNGFLDPDGCRDGIRKVRRAVDSTSDFGDVSNELMRREVDEIVLDRTECFCNFSSVTSKSRTSYPARAKTIAHPRPTRPAPTTVIKLLIA